MIWLNLMNLMKLRVKHEALKSALDSQSCPSFLTTRPNHFTARLGSHPCPKTGSAFALAIGPMQGSLSHILKYSVYSIQIDFIRWAGDRALKATVFHHTTATVRSHFSRCRPRSHRLWERGSGSEVPGSKLVWHGDNSPRICLLSQLTGQCPQLGN